MNWSFESSKLTVSSSMNSSSYSVSIGKAITAIVMFLVVLLAIFTPVIIYGKLKVCRQKAGFRDNLNLWIGRLSCFAAGVFLSTGFLDIFPDVIKAINEASLKLKIKLTFPLASFFTLIGFFLILSIEQFVLIYKFYLSKLQHRNRVAPIDQEDSKEAFLSNSIEASKEESQYQNDGLKPSTSTDSNLMDHEHYHQKNMSDVEDENEHEEEHESILHHNSSRIYALMSAMSFHAIFEGLAIGLGSTASGILQLVIAVSMHKLIIAASLGLNLATAPIKLTTKIIVGFIFAAGSPIGIGLGILIMSQERGHDTFYLVAGILEGIACGTFLYVVFFEILPHELGHNSHEDRAGKLFSLLFGFIFVCVYLLIVPMI